MYIALNQIHLLIYRDKSDNIRHTIVYNYIQAVMTMYEDLFYRRLSELRMAKGVSARDMSLSLGQSAGYINCVENRKSFPSMETFFYICDYLQVSPKEFFEDGFTYPDKINNIVEDLKHLDQEILDNLGPLIKCLNKENKI